MKTVISPRLRCWIGVAAGVVIFASAGCSEKGASPAQQAELKQGFDNRTSDMSKLPPEVRERMKGYAASGAPNSNPVKSAPATPPK